MRPLFLAALLGAGFVLIPAAEAHIESPAAAPAFAPTRFSVAVEGEGPDVILIPGLATSREVWDEARIALRGRYRLHLVELAGFGGSPAGANAEGPILPATVDELSRYIAAQRLQRPAVIGHSMGGFLGLLLARDHEDQVRRLLIVDSLPFIGVLFGPDATASSIAPQAAGLRDMLRARPAATPESAAAAAVGMSRTPEGRARVGRLTFEADPRVMGETAYEVATTDLRADLASIRVPITMLYPWDPNTLPEGRARALYEAAYSAAPNARLIAVPESQHFIMVDQPARFLDALHTFLSDTR
jgi:pimeloyl-ACP methyl ester carboxylesterase